MVLFRPGLLPQIYLRLAVVDLHAPRDADISLDAEVLPFARWLRIVDGMCVHTHFSSIVLRFRQIPEPLGLDSARRQSRSCARWLTLDGSRCG